MYYLKNAIYLNKIKTYRHINLLFITCHQIKSGGTKKPSALLNGFNTDYSTISDGLLKRLVPLFRCITIFSHDLMQQLDVV